MNPDNGFKETPLYPDKDIGICSKCEGKFHIFRCLKRGRYWMGNYDDTNYCPVCKEEGLVTTFESSSPELAKKKNEVSNRDKRNKDKGCCG